MAHRGGGGGDGKGGHIKEIRKRGRQEFSIQDYVMNNADNARERKISGEARERCSTQMAHQERGARHVDRFIYMRFALQGHAAQ